MEELSRNLTELGRAVSAEIHGKDVSLESARRRFMLARPDQLRRRTLTIGLAFAAALALLAVPIGLRFMASSSTATIAFVVGAKPGVVGQWIAADGGAPLALDFSEGTRMTLAPGARARVTEAAHDGASVWLEKGSMDAAVRHLGKQTSWSVHAGPFDVHVTGTRFVAAWDPGTEVFDLAMREGSVVVRGPQLEAGRNFSAGEHLRVRVRERVLEVRAAGSADVDEAPPAPPAVEAPAPPSTSDSAAPIASVAPAAATDRPSYPKLVAAGHFDEALAAADRVGFSVAIDRGSSTDVTALADAARLAGRRADARDALLALRRRFGARGSSAFLLGKLATEQPGLGDPASWFETYLKEEPRGPLAEQALGRLLELKKRSDPTGAKALGQRYLERYPSGPYAALARSLVEP